MQRMRLIDSVKMKPAFLSALLLATVLAVPMAPAAAAPPPATQAEVTHLFAYLAGSNCQFNRNGSWFSAPDAAAHLKKKYDYLADKGVIGTSERFIELGASKSSVSGKPYLVKCGQAQPVESAPWLGAELARYRQKAAGK
ncbi:hypothetical protein RR42_s3463 [Cupriavidus basilensis]|uniref:DUF5329 domain-containing protein n=2 Tax=Cupriavidus basilensis TaxID=68895 RepID=A0A0C4YSX8_9BURK|nr:hypothetical protein RR42_s3463 [Cupriavidus basilensis]